MDIIRLQVGHKQLYLQLDCFCLVILVIRRIRILVIIYRSALIANNLKRDNAHLEWRETLIYLRGYLELDKKVMIMLITLEAKSLIVWL